MVFDCLQQVIDGPVMRRIKSMVSTAIEELAKDSTTATMHHWKVANFAVFIGNESKT
jgi:hypothetical protein